MRGLELQQRHADRPILVLRTFSKAHALAALRVGYGVMDPALVGLFERLRQPFNVNALAQAAALASLADHEQVARSVARHHAAAGPLAEGLRALGVTVRPSQGNFLFCRFPVDTRPLCAALEQRGLIVRPLLAFGLDAHHTRITVGRPEQNAALLEGLQACMGAVRSA
jgi:histidinol-phosphate aminotransferase